jgi:WD40 repeat protein
MAMKLRNFMGMDRMDHLLTQLTHFDPIFVMKSDAWNQVFREIGQIGKQMETIYLLSSTCFRPKLSGTIIGSSSYDGTVRLWSVTGKCLKVLEGRSRPY